MDDVWVRLGLAFDEPIRDPLRGNIMVPAEFSAILSSPEFVKLSRILQLGPTQLVYPGATHTRRAHSIGVFEMAKRSLAALAAKSPLDGVDASGARGFLVAALCHDLGHFPYAHSLKELPLRDHESLTADVVRGPLRAAVSKAGADPARVRQALMGGFASSRILEVHGERMIKRTFDPGFRISLHQKDLNLALSSARALGVSLPNTASCQELFNACAAHEGSNWDHSAMVRALEIMANFKIGQTQS